MAANMASIPAGKPVEAPLPYILIVDDRKENLLVTEKVLKNLPARIFTAESGNEALSLMLRNKFAVVILDVQMPGMDGFEVAQLMQEEESMRGTPIIFATAISKEDKYASRAGEIGAVDYIFKPINPEILRSKVSVYLDLYVQREQILDLNADLQQSNEELERFAYICAHDLKTPLRAIYNLSQWLEDDSGDLLPAQSKKYISDIHKRVRRMEKLLDDTLAYARCSSKEQSGSSEMVEGKKLAEDVATLASPPQGFTLVVGPGFDNLRVRRLPLQQILYNLVNNAIKHHNRPASGRVEMDVEEKKDHYVFTVKDDGPGIPPQFHDKVFEMFQTLRPRDQVEGSGMGLAIVKKVLMTFGGKISVESDTDKGATFTFTWPKQDGPTK
ncbi:MAG: ATP-binding protein [Alphaproteobacteria bacterium]